MDITARKLFFFVISIVGVGLWVASGAWMVGVISFVGILLLGILMDKTRQGSLPWWLVVALIVCCLIVLYLGAPVVAWFVWGPWEGFIYGVITVAGLCMSARDAVVETNKEFK